MALSREQAIAIAEHYLAEHPEIQAKVVRAEEGKDGEWWVVLGHQSGGARLLLINPAGEITGTHRVRNRHGNGTRM